MKPIRLAIVGCGAVTERGHLPAAASMESVQVTLLVDTDRSRAENLARQYNVPHVTQDYTRVWDLAEAAIIALPHHLHAPISTALLARGVYVLVEKPMALSVAECDAMIDAADQGQAILAIGLMRRFLLSAQFTKEAIDAGLLGSIDSFDMREGFVYNWPVASDFFFRKDRAGGGVLFDTGAHTLDAVLWWFGDVASFEYFDDSYGGVEADCEIHLLMESGATGIVELSRTRDLRNTAIIRGEKATLESSLHTTQVRFLPRGVPFEIQGSVLPEQQPLGEQSLVDLLSSQLADWIGAIRNGSFPRVSGVEGRRSVALIEACYAQQKPLVLPWMAPSVDQVSMTIQGSNQ